MLLLLAAKCCFALRSITLSPRATLLIPRPPTPQQLHDSIFPGNQNRQASEQAPSPPRRLLHFHPSEILTTVPFARVSFASKMYKPLLQDLAESLNACITVGEVIDDDVVVESMMKYYLELKRDAFMYRRHAYIGPAPAQLQGEWMEFFKGMVFETKLTVSHSMGVQRHVLDGPHSDIDVMLAPNNFPLATSSPLPVDREDLNERVLQSLEEGDGKRLDKSSTLIVQYEEDKLDDSSSVVKALGGKDLYMARSEGGHLSCMRGAGSDVIVDFVVATEEKLKNDTPSKVIGGKTRG